MERKEVMSIELIREASNAIGESNDAMRVASDVMKRAELELDARQRLIDDYRRKNYAHERMVGKLYDLLKQDDLDGAMDIVRDEYFAIHGPSD
jgi:hypothetical protein